VEAASGVAAFPDDGATSAELLRAADRALYAAKQESKARVDPA
jgi:GGDEF domain-containing protein